jgi:hypothetical protein
MLEKPFEIFQNCPQSGISIARNYVIVVLHLRATEVDRDQRMVKMILPRFSVFVPRIRRLQLVTLKLPDPAPEVIVPFRVSEDFKP